MAASTVQDDPEDSMSCAYRSRRYRASVTAGPASVFWEHPTGHAQPPIPLRPPVAYPHRQAVMATSTSTDDAPIPPIPVSLVQYLWSQWQVAPPEDRGELTPIIGTLMRSPRWHWDVAVLPDPSLTDPQGSFVFERDGRPTIGIPIAKLRALWIWVLGMTETRSPVLRWWASSVDSPRWQELCTSAPLLTRRLTEQEWCHLYGYLSPRRLPEIRHEIRRLLHATSPDDRYGALTVLTQWLASPDHETRTVAAQMLHESTPVVAAIVRSHPFDAVIRDTLDRLVPTILTATRPEDRVTWVTTLWELVTDLTLNRWRRQMVAAALHHMMQDPMVAALVRALLRAHLSPHRITTELVWDPLLATCIRTVCADEVLRMIEQALATVRTTMGTDCNPIVWRLDPILAAGWGNGHDQRILQIIDSVPGPHWEAVLTEGVTASVGKAVCDRIRSWFPPDQAMALIADHIHAREERGDWPLAPLPAHLIPWVDDTTRSHPDRLHPTTIRRLWLTNPVCAWNVTQTMLHSDNRSVQVRALAAMDAGWGTMHDAKVATTLRARILERQDDRNGIETGIATAVAGIGRADPAIIASLLTDLATRGNTEVQRQLIRALHRGWGRGQDDLVWRIVETMVARDPLERIWDGAHDTLARAWDYQPPDVVVSLIDRLVTRGMHRRCIPIGEAIAACAPGWTHLPTAYMIARIAHHVAQLHAHAHTIAPTTRDTLVAAWASVIAAGAEHMSAEDIRAVLAPPLDPLPTLVSQRGCASSPCMRSAGGDVHRGSRSSNRPIARQAGAAVHRSPSRTHRAPHGWRETTASPRPTSVPRSRPSGDAVGHDPLRCSYHRA